MGSYRALFDSVKQSILAAFPRNFITVKRETKNPRIGSFEISLSNCNEPKKLVFSKLKTGKKPNPVLVVSLLQKEIAMRPCESSISSSKLRDLEQLLWSSGDPSNDGTWEWVGENGRKLVEILFRLEDWPKLLELLSNAFFMAQYIESCGSKGTCATIRTFFKESARELKNEGKLKLSDCLHFLQERAVEIDSLGFMNVAASTSLQCVLSAKRWMQKTCLKFQQRYSKMSRPTGKELLSLFELERKIDLAIILGFLALKEHAALMKTVKSTLKEILDGAMTSQHDIAAALLSEANIAGMTNFMNRYCNMYPTEQNFVEIRFMPLVDGWSSKCTKALTEAVKSEIFWDCTQIQLVRLDICVVPVEAVAVFRVVGSDIQERTSACGISSLPLLLEKGVVEHIQITRLVPVKHRSLFLYLHFTSNKAKFDFKTRFAVELVDEIASVTGISVESVKLLELNSFQTNARVELLMGERDDPRHVVSKMQELIDCDEEDRILFSPQHSKLASVLIDMDWKTGSLVSFWAPKLSLYLTSATADMIQERNLMNGSVLPAMFRLLKVHGGADFDWCDLCHGLDTCSQDPAETFSLQYCLNQAKGHGIELGDNSIAPIVVALVGNRCSWLPNLKVDPATTWNPWITLASRIQLELGIAAQNVSPTCFAFVRNSQSFTNSEKFLHEIPASIQSLFHETSEIGKRCVQSLRLEKKAHQVFQYKADVHHFSFQHVDEALKELAEFSEDETESKMKRRHLLYLVQEELLIRKKHPDMENNESRCAFLSTQLSKYGSAVSKPSEENISHLLSVSGVHLQLESLLLQLVHNILPVFSAFLGGKRHRGRSNFREWCRTRMRQYRKLDQHADRIESLRLSNQGIWATTVQDMEHSAEKTRILISVYPGSRKSAAMSALAKRLLGQSDQAIIVPFLRELESTEVIASYLVKELASKVWEAEYFRSKASAELPLRVVISKIINNPATRRKQILLVLDNLTLDQVSYFAAIPGITAVTSCSAQHQEIYEHFCSSEAVATDVIEMGSLCDEEIEQMCQHWLQAFDIGKDGFEFSVVKELAREYLREDPLSLRLLCHEASEIVKFQRSEAHLSHCISISYQQSLAFGPSNLIGMVLFRLENALGTDRCERFLSMISDPYLWEYPILRQLLELNGTEFGLCLRTLQPILQREKYLVLEHLNAIQDEWKSRHSSADEDSDQPLTSSSPKNQFSAADAGVSVVVTIERDQHSLYFSGTGITIDRVLFEYPTIQKRVEELNLVLINEKHARNLEKFVGNHDQDLADPQFLKLCDHIRSEMEQSTSSEQFFSSNTAKKMRSSPSFTNPFLLSPEYYKTEIVDRGYVAAIPKSKLNKIKTASVKWLLGSVLVRKGWAFTAEDAEPIPVALDRFRNGKVPAQVVMNWAVEVLGGSSHQTEGFALFFRGTRIRNEDWICTLGLPPKPILTLRRLMLVVNVAGVPVFASGPEGCSVRLQIQCGSTLLQLMKEAQSFAAADEYINPDHFAIMEEQLSIREFLKKHDSDLSSGLVRQYSDELRVIRKNCSNYKEFLSICGEETLKDCPFQAGAVSLDRDAYYESPKIFDDTATWKVVRRTKIDETKRKLVRLAICDILIQRGQTKERVPIILGPTGFDALVESVKKWGMQRLGLPLSLTPNYRLMKGDQHLSEYSTLENSGVKEKDILRLEQYSMRVSVRNFQGKLVNLEVCCETGYDGLVRALAKKIEFDEKTTLLGSERTNLVSYLMEADRDLHDYFPFDIFESVQDNWFRKAAGRDDKLRPFLAPAVGVGAEGAECVMNFVPRDDYFQKEFRVDEGDIFMMIDIEELHREKATMCRNSAGEVFIKLSRYSKAEYSVTNGDEAYIANVKIKEVWFQLAEYLFGKNGAETHMLWFQQHYEMVYYQTQKTGSKKHKKTNIFRWEDLEEPLGNAKFNPNQSQHVIILQRKMVEVYVVPEENLLHQQRRFSFPSDCFATGESLMKQISTKLGASSYKELEFLWQPPHSSTIKWEREMGAIDELTVIVQRKIIVSSPSSLRSLMSSPTAKSPKTTPMAKSLMLEESMTFTILVALNSVDVATATVVFSEELYRQMPIHAVMASVWAVAKKLRQSQHFLVDLRKKSPKPDVPGKVLLASPLGSSCPSPLDSVADPFKSLSINVKYWCENFQIEKSSNETIFFATFRKGISLHMIRDAHIYISSDIFRPKWSNTGWRQLPDRQILKSPQFCLELGSALFDTKISELKVAVCKMELLAEASEHKIQKMKSWFEVWYCPTESILSAASTPCAVTSPTAKKKMILLNEDVTLTECGIQSSRDTFIPFGKGRGNLRIKLVPSISVLPAFHNSVMAQGAIEILLGTCSLPNADHGCVSWLRREVLRHIRSKFDIGYQGMDARKLIMCIETEGTFGSRILEGDVQGLNLLSSTTGSFRLLLHVKGADVSLLMNSETPEEKLVGVNLGIEGYSMTASSLVEQVMRKEGIAHPMSEKYILQKDARTLAMAQSLSSQGIEGPTVLILKENEKFIEQIPKLLGHRAEIEIPPQTPPAATEQHDDTDVQTPKSLPLSPLSPFGKTLSPSFIRRSAALNGIRLATRK